SPGSAVQATSGHETRQTHAAFHRRTIGALRRRVTAKMRSRSQEELREESTGSGRRTRDVSSPRQTSYGARKFRGVDTTIAGVRDPEEPEPRLEPLTATVPTGRAGRLTDSRADALLDHPALPGAEAVGRDRSIAPHHLHASSLHLHLDPRQLPLERALHRAP